MSPSVELNLAMILFLPWFAILGGLYWVYPRTPRTPVRNAFDAASLLLAVVAAILGTWWSYAHADLSVGTLWRQLLASTVSYALFLGVMALATWLRHRWITHPREPGGGPACVPGIAP